MLIWCFDYLMLLVVSTSTVTHLGFIPLCCLRISATTKNSLIYIVENEVTIDVTVATNYVKQEKIIRLEENPYNSMKRNKTSKIWSELKKKLFFLMK